MRQTCITHPPGERYIIVRPWQIAAMGGDYCAAFLVAFFEYVHNRKLEEAREAQAINAENAALGLPPTAPEWDMALIQCHTETELKEAILGLYQEKRIREARDKVAAVGFIVYDTTPRYNTKGLPDRTKAFVFQPEAVNEWIDHEYPKAVRLQDAATKDAQEAKRLKDRMDQKDQADKRPDGQTDITPDAQTVKSPLVKFPNGQKTVVHKNKEDSTFTSPNGESTGTPLTAPPAPAVRQALMDDSIFFHPLVDPVVSMCKLAAANYMPAWQKRELKLTLFFLLEQSATEAEVATFEERWYQDWRGKRGTAPTLSDVRAHWLAILARREGITPHNAHNGSGEARGANAVTKLVEMQQKRRQNLGGQNNGGGQ